MKLILSILIPLTIGAVAGFFTMDSVNTWYATLHKPSFDPPNWLFAPVWTGLYILMGIGLYLIWKLPAHTKNRSLALQVFGIQLFLNFCWSFIFFRLKLPKAAFTEILVLLFFIVLMTIIFYRLNRIAAFLQIPYIIWVSFAMFLNYSIWQLNK